MNMRAGPGHGDIRSGPHSLADQRVALCLSRLFWHSMRKLDLSQEELGNLVGLSRQTVNRVLQSLERQGWYRSEFGRVSILDDDGWRHCFRTAAERESSLAGEIQIDDGARPKVDWIRSSRRWIA